MIVSMETRKPNQVFVRVPNERGRWVLTDRCVVEVECPQCKSVIGEPCKGKHMKYWAGTHFSRRNAWTRRGTKEQKQQMPEDHLDTVGEEEE